MINYSNKFSFLLLLMMMITATIYGQVNSQTRTQQEERSCIDEKTCDANNPQQPVASSKSSSSATSTATTKDGIAQRVKKNRIWNSVVEQQGGVPFGRVLDAGTGINSLNFVATLVEHGMTGYKAVTGSKSMHKSVREEAEKLGIADIGEVVYGNWFSDDDNNPKFISPDETYDVILVDYLIGAMDAFSPYMQDAMLKKLVSMLNPGGRMYVSALEPIPDGVSERDSSTTNSVAGANMICQMKHLRDSCILLAGRRIYREFPRTWMERQFESISDMTVLKTEVFPTTWNGDKFTRQLNNGRMYLKSFISKELAKTMTIELDEIEKQFSILVEKIPGKRVRFGSDYLVAAEKTTTTKQQKEEEEEEDLPIEFTSGPI